MNFPCTEFKNKSVLFFYKGTTFPKIVDIPDLEKIMFQGADVMIARGLRMGVSMEEQKKDYKEQLDLMERTFCDISQGKMLDDKVVEKAAKSLGISKHDFYYFWCVNICALLKMKVIKNDDMNGILSAIALNFKR